jgi:nitrile hydratase accessory protein
MSDATRPDIEIEGPAAPPRRNGELIFQEPWEGRAFGLAVTLRDQGHFPWEAFRQRLIGAIVEADCLPAGEPRPGYYENWLAALRQLLVSGGVTTESEIAQRMEQFASGRPDITNPGAR